MLFSYIPYFLLALIIHEAGHCLAAYVCRVTVNEFGIGWGPRLCGIRLGKIEFVMRALPVGAYVRLDLSELFKRSLSQQTFVLLAGIIANLMAAVLTDGTRFSLMNYLLAATNILPLYQQDSWKCGMVILRSIFRRKSSLVEWTFTIAGSCLSVALFVAFLVRGFKSSGR